MRKPYRCQACGHEWYGRQGRTPVACPNRECQTRRWQASPENARPQARAQDDPARMNR